jgi:hypothetical protein
MSTNLNSLSGVILQDFIKPCMGRKQMSEETASTTMKLIVVVLGIFCTAMVFLVDKLGAIIQVSKHKHPRIISIRNKMCTSDAHSRVTLRGVIAGGV